MNTNIVYEFRQANKHQEQDELWVRFDVYTGDIGRRRSYYLSKKIKSKSTNVKVFCYHPGFRQNRNVTFYKETTTILSTKKDARKMWDSLSEDGFNRITY